MMNLLRTTYAVRFLCFYRIRSLQVCASGAAKDLALLLIGVIKYWVPMWCQISHHANYCPSLYRYRRHGVGATGVVSVFSDSLNIHQCVSVCLLVLWRVGLTAGFQGKQQLSVTLAENSVWEQEILLQYLFSTVIDGHFCVLWSLCNDWKHLVCAFVIVIGGTSFE